MNTELYIQQELKRFLTAKNIRHIQPILQRPKDPKFGDYASNIAMQLAKTLKKKPKTIAEELLAFIHYDSQYIEKAEIAGPGFINFYGSSSNLYKVIGAIFSQKNDYGKSDIAQGKSAQIEFVSANPTGPLTIGHGRGAVLGDTIARLLEAIGYNVTREYYFNNAGRQMRVLGESVQLRYQQLLGEKIDFPSEYYQGEYIIDIAQKAIEAVGDSLKDTTDIHYFKNLAEKIIFDDIRKTIQRLGFAFDSFYNEKSLYDEGKIDAVIDRLRKKSLIKEKEGATWFLTSKLGFEQDRVFIKSSGEPTYRLPDTAYHIEKIKKGFDLMIDIFGADHIATYPDVLAAVKALDYDVDKIKVLINQFVTLTENGEKVKMSTRKANFVTIDDLLDEVGVDVTRYFFLMRNMNSHLNFDLKLAKTQSDENPVFYIQYAHARICSILRLANEQGFSNFESATGSLLSTEEEKLLLQHLNDFPKTVQNSATNYEPHRLVNYLFDLAGIFHRFYTNCRVISDDKELSQARLVLINATKIVFSNGLGLLGISAPEKM
jgi:arginyl-tRNA synthetase